MIECQRGIPFRLKVVDEAGEPVDAEVEYHLVSPNPHFDAYLRDGTYNNVWPPPRLEESRGTLRRSRHPGPGAVMVKMPDRPDYRPAHVDPKAFFAPGKTDCTTQESIGLRHSGHPAVRPELGRSARLRGDRAREPARRLEAAGVRQRPSRDRPRQVTLLDPEGNPVVGVQTEGLTPFPWDSEPRLRALTFPLTKLHPDRVRRITFVREDRKLIGFLMARGNGETPYTVRMRPWAEVTGRILDENGKPLSATGPPGKQEMPATLAMKTRSKFASHDDPDVGEFPHIRTDGEGRFRVERLIPAQRDAEVYRGIGQYAGPAFEDLVSSSPARSATSATSAPGRRSMSWAVDGDSHGFSPRISDDVERPSGNSRRRGPRAGQSRTNGPRRRRSG